MTTIIKDVDPTWVDMKRDPTIQRFKGWARHGNTPFDVPYISHIKDNLYQGGCQDGLVLPENIKYVFSLYIWEAYDANHEYELEAIKMYDDSDEPDFNNIVELAAKVRDASHKAPTLVHCQAGLNRSSLVAGTALWLNGMPSAEIAPFLRSRRSPAVLCNKTFEHFVSNLDKRANECLDIRPAIENSVVD